MAKNTNQTANSAKERGNRIRQLREALRYSRTKFSDKYTSYGISAGTLQGWELGRWHGVTIKGAHKLIDAFRAEGLEVTPEWLLFGIGDNPLRGVKRYGPLKKIPQPDEEKIIARELALFHQLNHNTVDTIITDDAMAPFLKPGDYVAGKRYIENEIEEVLGQICIIQTHTGNVLVRNIEKSNTPGLYNLISTNNNATVTPLNFESIKILSAAPILWIRKRAL